MLILLEVICSVKASLVYGIVMFLCTFGIRHIVALSHRRTWRGFEYVSIFQTLCGQLAFRAATGILALTSPQQGRAFPIGWRRLTRCCRMGSLGV